MNVGLIGLGRHGERYAKHLLSSNSIGNLVAVCRRDADQGQAFADTHGVKFHRLYQDLIGNPEVQAVIIVTPPWLIHQIALEAIRQKKPLLIEKPLAVSSGEARQIVEEAKLANIPLMTAQTLRFDDTVKKLNEWAQGIGRLKYLSLTARLDHQRHLEDIQQGWKGRGALLEIGVHLMNIARVITREEVREAYCETIRPYPEAPEDQAWGRLTTQSEIPCLFDVSRKSASRMTRLELIGETGQVCANWTTGTVSLQRERDAPEHDTLPITPTIHHVLEGFIHALSYDQPMPVTGEDGLRAVEIADACYESAKTGRPIQLRELR